MGPSSKRALALRLGWAGVCLATLGLACEARAAGIETTSSGTLHLGRAAAQLRLNDFMAVWLNPANLALVPGRDLGGELRLPILHACFDRARDNRLEYQVNDPDAGLFGEESFGNECNDGSRIPSGALGFAQSFARGWGWGIGFFTPNVIPHMSFGHDVVVTQYPLPDETLEPTLSGVESPNRFLMLDRSVLGGFLQAGAGIQLRKDVRIGLSLGFGIAYIHNVNVASVAGGTFRDQELLAEVRARDLFIPRVTASIVATPLDALEFMVALTYQDDVEASGQVDINSNGFRSGPRTDCRVAAPDKPGVLCRSEDAELSIPLPNLEVTLGARYAQRRGARERVLDPMRDELWDVEIAGTWTRTSHVDRYELHFYDQEPNAPGSTRVVFSSSPEAVPVAIPPTFVIPYNWDDTFAVRVGGDYNVLPGLLSLRAGVSYESRAIPVEFMNIDAWAVARLGLHVGATVALGDLKLSAGYAHVFHQSVQLGVGAGQVPENVSQNPAAALPVNEGYYQAALDVISLQLNCSF